MTRLHIAHGAGDGLAYVEGLTAGEVHRRLQRCARLGDVGAWGLARYLLEVEERRLYDLWGASDTARYAETHLDLSPRRTRELLAAGRALRGLPILERAFLDQDLGWSKVLLLLRVLRPEHPEHQEAWVRLAKEKSCARLKVELQLAREGGGPREPGAAKGLPEIRRPVRFDLGVVPYRMLELAQQKLAAELGRPVTQAELQETVLGLYLTMEQDGTVPGWTHVPTSLYRIVLRPLVLDEDAPLFVETDDGPMRVGGSEADDVVARERASCAICDGEVLADDEPGPGEHRSGIDDPTPPHVRRRVLARDDHRCRCCGRTKDLQVHHIEFRSHGGPTRMWNLVTICMRCHALVHAGLLRIEGRTQAKAVFLDGEGRAVHDAHREVDRELLLRLAAPIERPRDPVAAQAPTPLVTLDTVPDRIDGAWWRGHAELLHPRRDGGLELRPGRAAEVVEGEDVHEHRVPLPFEEAFAGVVGQDRLLQTLALEAKGSRARGAPFPHTLLLGPAGTGKTTLATGIGQAFGARVHHGVGPDLVHVHDLVALLAGLGPDDMLFVDEIHAVPRKVLEILYEAMAARRLSLTIRCGARARTVTLELPAFSLLGATSEPSRLPEPLVTRFQLREYLAEYGERDLAQIAQARAAQEDLALATRAAYLLARHARGRPREVVRLVERVVNRARGEGREALDEEGCRRALRGLGYDERGLQVEERRCLDALAGCPTPVSGWRLARMAGMGVRRLLEEVEPWLCRNGWVRVTPQGRVPGPRLLGQAGRLAAESA